MYFNLTLLEGETAVLDFTDPLNVTFTSNFQGNILSAISPGSSFDFFMKPDNNAISVFLNWDGVVLDYLDTFGSVSNFLLTGVNGSNSDNGTLYVSVVQLGPPGTPSHLIYIYSDAARTNLVATLSGAYTTTGTKTVIEQNGSGISGTLDVDSVGDDTNRTIYIKSYPVVSMTWRNTHASTDGAFPGRLVR